MVKINDFIKKNIENEIYRELARYMYGKFLEIVNESNFVGYTKHGEIHTQLIIEKIDVITKDLNVKLKDHEFVVLYGSAFFHDISIFKPFWGKLNKKINAIYKYIDIRNKHGYLSGKWVMEVLFNEFIEMKNYEIPSDPYIVDIFEAIKEICVFHTRLDGYYDFPEIKNDGFSRLPLLAVIFVFADMFDMGKNKINIHYVLRSKLSYLRKKKWLISALIDSVVLKNNSVIVKLIQPDNASFDNIEQNIDPYIKEIKDFILCSNKVLTQYHISKIKKDVVLKVSSHSGQDSEEVEKIFKEEYKILNVIKLGALKIRNSIRKKLKPKGAIAEDGLVKNEFIVMRKWGSSNHRFYFANNGLEQGGGYFLSSNHKGLVIDPGYDFVRNFFSFQNLDFQTGDISGLLITHSHDDHCYDTEGLVTLQYLMRKENENIKFEDFPILCSESTLRKYYPISAIDEFVKFTMIDITDNSRPKLKSIPNINQNPDLLNSMGIKLEAKRAFHNETPWHKNNTGFSLRIKCNIENDQYNYQAKIGFTSDTSYLGQVYGIDYINRDPWEDYLPEIRNLDEETIQLNRLNHLVPFLNECDLIVMHFGNFPDGIDFEECLHQNDCSVNINNWKFLYPKHHLGHGGCKDC